MKPPSSERKQQTIIIVEDDNGNATVLEMLLAMQTTHISFSYRSTKDVLEHLDEIKRSQPALFLIDYFLPDIDGLSLYHALQNIHELKKIPVVLVSASYDDFLREEVQYQGITLLQKPYDVDVLLAVITQYL